MASLQVNKLASTQESASAKSLHDKEVAIQEKLLLEGTNSGKMALINTNHGPNSSLWPREGNTGNRYMYLSV